jgi:hypothetical protein
VEKGKTAKLQSSANICWEKRRHAVEKGLSSSPPLPFAPPVVSLSFFALTLFFFLYIFTVRGFFWT